MTRDEAFVRTIRRAVRDRAYIDFGSEEPENIPEWRNGYITACENMGETIDKAAAEFIREEEIDPFGYWVEQKGAEPALIREPAYIPEESPLRRVTPVYASPKSEDIVSNWRGRRLTICRAAATLRRVADHLNADDDKYPREEPQPVVTHADQEELKNLIDVLLRMMLLANDGRVSPSRLASF